MPLWTIQTTNTTQPFTLVEPWYTASSATTTITVTIGGGGPYHGRGFSTDAAIVDEPFRNVALGPPPEAPPPVAGHAAARDRARTTLLTLLTPTERERYETTGAFQVEGSGGGRYEVRDGYMQNVYRYDEHGRRTHRLCAHPDMFASGRRLPNFDAMIAQLLMLRHDEHGFLAIANATPIEQLTA